VCRNVVTMRAAADPEAEVVSQAIWGERVAILERNGPWARLRTPDAYEGWAPHDALVEAEAEGAPAMVTSLLEPALEAPRAGSEQLTLLPLGARVDAIGHDRHGEYRAIHYPHRGIAFVRASALCDVTPDGIRFHRSAAIHCAERLIGVPYLWGGRTPFGLDCSGFTQLVFAVNGVSLPRDAYQQAVWPGFDPITVASVTPGDLVFFAGDADPQGRGITHVGMALESPAFLHSAGGRGVVVSSLLDEPYGRQIRHAARIRTGPHARHRSGAD
jgi:cell wall-associated NlpC family hydrolase